MKLFLQTPQGHLGVAVAVAVAGNGCAVGVERDADGDEILVFGFMIICDDAEPIIRALNS